jgi:hypothetical protein
MATGDQEKVLVDRVSITPASPPSSFLLLLSSHLPPSLKYLISPPKLCLSLSSFFTNIHSYHFLPSITFKSAFLCLCSHLETFPSSAGRRSRGYTCFLLKTQFFLENNLRLFTIGQLDSLLVDAHVIEVLQKIYPCRQGTNACHSSLTS